MRPLEAGVVLLAGLAAGAINAVVGSGTLITFPTLLALGVSPVPANVANGIGLVPGGVAGAVGYRRELRGQRRRILVLAGASVLGGALGAVLLLALPSAAFAAVVPVLIGLGCLLVVLQPRIQAWVARRHEATGGVPEHGAWWVWPGALLVGTYGGYFGAAQGVLLMAVLGTGIDEPLQRLNGVKNVLAAITNAVSGLVFVIVASVDWRIAGLIAAGSVVGGLLGARYGRRLPSSVLRGLIVLVGVVALAFFLLG